MLYLILHKASINRIALGFFCTKMLPTSPCRSQTANIYGVDYFFGLEYIGVMRDDTGHALDTQHVWGIYELKKYIQIIRNQYDLSLDYIG